VFSSGSEFHGFVLKTFKYRTICLFVRPAFAGNAQMRSQAWGGRSKITISFFTGNFYRIINKFAIRPIAYEPGKF